MDKDIQAQVRATQDVAQAIRKLIKAIDRSNAILIEMGQNMKEED